MASVREDVKNIYGGTVPNPLQMNKDLVDGSLTEAEQNTVNVYLNGLWSQRCGWN